MCSGTSEGGGCPASQDCMLSLTYSKVERPCIAQVCTVDMMVSQNRMPRPERVKYDNLRLITQPRSACSAALFVGGTSGLRENVHSAGHILIRLAQVLAVRLQLNLDASLQPDKVVCAFGPISPANQGGIDHRADQPCQATGPLYGLHLDAHP